MLTISRRSWLEKLKLSTGLPYWAFFFPMVQFPVLTSHLLLPLCLEIQEHPLMVHLLAVFKYTIDCLSSSYFTVFFLLCHRNERHEAYDSQARGVRGHFETNMFWSKMEARWQCHFMSYLLGEFKWQDSLTVK